MIYVINFKAYMESTGRNALKLLESIDSAANEKKARIVACVQATNIATASSSGTKTPIFAQHVDAISFGAHTGHTLPEAVKEAGASGTLINHCEKKLSLEEIEKTVKRAKEAGLQTIVCAATPEECLAVSKFNPDYVSIEPPELIGSGKAVSRDKPDVIINARKLVPKNIPLLAGAGITTREDVLKAKELGCAGVLIASAFVKAKHTKEKLLELII